MNKKDVLDKNTNQDFATLTHFCQVVEYYYKSKDAQIYWTSTFNLVDIEVSI